MRKPIKLFRNFVTVLMSFVFMLQPAMVLAQNDSPGAQAQESNLLQETGPEADVAIKVTENTAPEPMLPEAEDVTTDFTDAKFLEKIYTLLGTASGSPISATQLATIETLDISNAGIKNLAGLQHFTGLKELNCSNNEINQLDVSLLLQLEILDCSRNKLSKLDITGLPKLESLKAANNYMTSELQIQGLPEYLFRLDYPMTKMYNFDYFQLVSRDVTDVVLRYPTAVMKPGEYLEQRAMVFPLATDKRDVIWASSDPEIATVTVFGSYGYIYSIKPGRATITATSKEGGIVGSSDLLVVGDGAKINAPSNVSLTAVGEQQQISAEVEPASLQQDLLWESSEPENISVDQTGRVTAHKANSFSTITATLPADANGYVAKAIIYASVQIPASSVSIQPSALQLSSGESSALTATVLPVDAYRRDVTWFSSNSSVAWVNKDGVVQASAASGTTTITAESKQTPGVKASILVTVASPLQTVPVTSVEISPATLQLEVGSRQTLTAVVSPANATNPRVSWATTHNEILSVDRTGQIQAIQPGSATIQVTTEEGGETAFCQVTVTKATPVPSSSAPSSSSSVTPESKAEEKPDDKNPVENAPADKKPEQVEKISLNKTSVKLNAGASYSLNFTIKPASLSGSKVVWSSSNSKIVRVSSKGVLKAVKQGKSTVTAKTGGVTAQCVVTVLPAVSKVTLSQKALVLRKGKTARITTTILPKSARGGILQYSSSKPKVATVSASGQIKAVGKGSAIISVKAGNKTVKCKITVK